MEIFLQILPFRILLEQRGKYGKDFLLEILEKKNRM